MTAMSKSDAAELHAMVEAKQIDQTRCRDIVVKYVMENRNALWEDALADHGLLTFSSTD